MEPYWTRESDASAFGIRRATIGEARQKQPEMTLGDKQTSDPELGTWVLNPAKSTFDPGPPPKSQRRTVKKVGEGQRLRNETATSDGRHALVEYTAKFDGRNYPVTGSPYGDAVILERLDSHTVKATVKKGGTLVLTDTRVVSSDGKVLTITQLGMNLNGQPMHNVLVYDRKHR